MAFLESTAIVWLLEFRIMAPTPITLLCGFNAASTFILKWPGGGGYYLFVEFIEWFVLIALLLGLRAYLKD